MMPDDLSSGNIRRVSRRILNQQNNLTREEARRRASLITAPLTYKVALDLTGAAEDFAADTTITFGCAQPGAETFIDFLPATVERIELNGLTLPTDAVDGARIHLSPLQRNNQLRVLARCAYQHTGVGLSRFKDPVDGLVYLHTQFETFDAHRVYPCFDQPDLKATFQFEVTAPAGWEVVSNTPAVRRPPLGDPSEHPVVWSFAATPPISTYLAAIVAGPYHVVREQHRGIALGLYCRQSLAQYLDPSEIFEITRQGLDFYERVFGYPYAFGKYDQLFVPEFSFGAMENAGCVTFSEGMIFRSRVTEAARERRADTILHEMAHMWFGDLVTMRWWDDLWLNESFATFMAILSQVRATRFRQGWTTFANQVKSSARRQDQLPTSHPIAADMPDIESVHLNFDAITYQKGASVLRQLVAWLGEDAFLEGVRRYFRRREFANAELADFLAALEEGSGRDLKTWSKEWLQTAGVNTLRVATATTAADGTPTMTACAIVQEAPPEWPTLRSHRLGVGLYDLADGRLLRRRFHELDVVGARTEVPALIGERLPDLVLLNDGDLAYAKIRLDDRSLSTLTRHLAGLPDSLARALCWSAAWDMVRDAELPARRFYPLVLRNIHGETEIAVLQRLLEQYAGGVHVYGDPRHAAAALGELAAFARHALERAEPGGDFQLAWARAFIASARSEDHVGVVRELLEGTITYPGLQVDTDLRWSMVRSLTGTGAAGEEMIAAELERDPTDQGQRHAAAARAGRPSPEAKAQAWSLITEDSSLSLALMRAIMGGFHHPDQRDLLEPYAARYFHALDPVWRQRSIEVALAVARAMYPRLVIGDEVVQMTTEALDSDSTPGPIRRILLEERDEIRRALRARALDASATA